MKIKNNGDDISLTGKRKSPVNNYNLRSKKRKTGTSVPPPVTPVNTLYISPDEPDSDSDFEIDPRDYNIESDEDSDFDLEISDMEAELDSDDESQESPDSEESPSDSEDSEYFEADFTKVRDTLLKHILENLSRPEQAKFGSKIKQGLDDALELLKVGFMVKFMEAKPCTDMWKLGLGPEEIKAFGPQVEALRQDMTSEKVTIKRILENNKLSQDEKKICLKLYDTLNNIEPFTLEHKLLETQINSILEAAKKSTHTKEDLEKYKKVETRLRALTNMNKPLKYRILDADIADEQKVIIYEKYMQWENMDKECTTAASLKEWLENTIKIPFNKLKPSIIENYDSITDFLKDARQKFDQKLYGMESIKEELLCMINTRHHKQDTSGLAIGLEGSPGCGKTLIGRTLAEVLDLPFYQISLGGMVDSTILDGQHVGWVGSSPGMVIKALQQMGYRNGVILFDEIDKLATTCHGKEVQYSLLHITDFTQNKEFRDHYVSDLTVDLSNLIFIYALNGTSGMDPALLNRLPIMHVSDYSHMEKRQILCNYLLPEVLTNVGLTTADVSCSPETAAYIINKVEALKGKEGGLRTIKEYLRILVNRLNLAARVSVADQQNAAISFALDIKFPVKLTSQIVDKLYKPDGKNTLFPMYI